MATYSLVHGAWHGGWAWDLVRAELESHGHVVHTPDLPCEDVDAGLDEYAAAVPPADVVVGHSLGARTIPAVEAAALVFLAGVMPSTQPAFVDGFGDARVRDELGRSYYPDPADAARELQYPPEHAHLAAKLRRQAPYSADVKIPDVPTLSIVRALDACVAPDYQREAARTLGIEAVELEAGHSAMLTHPRELAELLLRVEL